ncbi:hypothetical protein [Kaistella jeonii]|uniref:Uncharacterized protein n=1 Tax=Kaistella jeonii TaxID=266749 RepID=A0A0C1D1K1_9FLAO|nr:hypothetical protein [Kaistella jeonii]KIA90726.1 hypothetical protein OA86_02325 [Kaistella jeonii]SFB68635.1 hypothetical protein SAMN05421876_10151 [Kaistella jeonii]VEI94658.1 Uncharacterised protein [Kaistella jeonii]
MTYNIIGIFPTIDEAISAANRLKKAGFIKQFPGFTRNTKFHPESLVEDHFLDENEITVYTPNLNRAHKAKNILMKFGADIKKATGISYKKDQSTNSSDSSSVLFQKKGKMNENVIKN